MALTASAQEDGVRQILFANPLVRWEGKFGIRAREIYGCFIPAATILR